MSNIYSRSYIATSAKLLEMYSRQFGGQLEPEVSCTRHRFPVDLGGRLVSFR